MLYIIETINHANKKVKVFYLPEYLNYMCVHEDCRDRVTALRKFAAQQNLKRQVRACNFVLGWLGDPKQPLTFPQGWPLELRDELNTALAIAEDIIQLPPHAAVSGLAQGETSCPL